MSPYRLLTEFVEFFVLQLKVVVPEPLAGAGALGPQSAPLIVGGMLGRVGDHCDVRLLRIFQIQSATAARNRAGHLAQPVGREESDTGRQEGEEHCEGREDEQTVLSHRRRRSCTHTSSTVSLVHNDPTE